MSKDDVARAALFATIDPAAVTELISTMTVTHVARGSVIFRQGDTGDRLYVISAGKVKLGQHSSDGRENLLAVLGPGEVVGELSLFDPGPRSATATAVVDSELYELGHQLFVRWLAVNPEAAPGIIADLARRLRQTDEALADLVFTDVPGRVAKALLDMADRFGTPTDAGLRVEHDLTQEELAHLVGASRETVNKALADFTTRGWIRRDGRALVLRNVDRLRRRAR